MKINIVLSVLAKSGGSDVIYKYVDLLRGKGHDVVVYKPVLAFNMRRYPNRIKNQIHRIYCTCKGILRAFQKDNFVNKYIPYVADIFIRDADIVMATAWPTAFSVNSLKESKGKKVYFIQDFEIWDSEEYGLKSYLLPLNKIVISSWINKQLKEKLNIGPFPIVYNGLDLKKFSNPNKKYKKNDETIRCLMLNHVLEKKGVDDGIKAYEIAHKKFPNMVLEAFGLCGKENLPDYVEYIQNPSQQELVEMYCRSDIFIFPSHTEGWGLTPLEAMACKCAVVGTDTGFVLDLGEDGENMLISSAKEIISMSENIIRLCKDSVLREKISEAGWRMTRGLDWCLSADHLEELLIKMSIRKVGDDED